MMTGLLHHENYYKMYNFLDNILIFIKVSSNIKMINYYIYYKHMKCVLIPQTFTCSLINLFF